jgi:hypothetical protein
MMYRSGWGLKDLGQSRILAIDISRQGFEWALTNSCLSHAQNTANREEWRQLLDNTPVRIQWDPERDLFLQPQNYRAIQIGLTKEAVELYVNSWIQRITDVTQLARVIHTHLQRSELEQAQSLVPVEKPYPMQQNQFSNLF